MEVRQEDEHAIIVGKVTMSVSVNQEESIQRMTQENPNSIVILLNGAPIDMTAWEPDCKAVLEAWYPGEQGARALGEILFGQLSPSGKLPICIPRNVGQVPIFYAMKPSGRGYGYNENDGSPLYPFGFGLSYTDFKYNKMNIDKVDGGWNVKVSVKNIGKTAGKDVVQIYVKAPRGKIDKPSRELKGFAKTPVLNPGETCTVEIFVSEESLASYDENAKKWVREKGRYRFIAAKHSLDSSKRKGIRL
jgi:beta-glucosidase